MSRLRAANQATSCLRHSGPAQPDQDDHGLRATPLPLRSGYPPRCPLTISRLKCIYTSLPQEVERSCGLQSRHLSSSYSTDTAFEQDMLEDCACQKARVAARALTRAYDHALRPAGLRAGQYAVLVAAATQGPMSITILANALGMDRTTLSRNLGPLEKEGLIAVGPEGRGRRRTLEITKKGRSLLREALPLWKQAQATLRRRLGDRNWAYVHDILERLIRAA